MIKTIQYGFQSNMLNGPKLIKECQANNVVVEAENELLSNFELNRCRLDLHFTINPKRHVAHLISSIFGPTFQGQVAEIVGKPFGTFRLLLVNNPKRHGQKNLYTILETNRYPLPIVTFELMIFRTSIYHTENGGTLGMVP